MVTMRTIFQGNFQFKCQTDDASIQNHLVHICSHFGSKRNQWASEASVNLNKKFYAAKD